jgi:hypothetical protein
LLPASGDIWVNTSTRPVGGTTGWLESEADEDPFAVSELSVPVCSNRANAAGVDGLLVDEAEFCESFAEDAFCVAAPSIWSFVAAEGSDCPLAVGAPAASVDEDLEEEFAD